MPDVWIPIRVDVTSGHPVEGSLQLQAGAARYQHAVTLAAGAAHRTAFTVVIPDPRHPLIVSLHDAAGDVVAQDTLPVARDRIVSGIVVAVSAERAGLEFLNTQTRRQAAAYLTERDLPDHWAAYEGVDLVVLRDVDERATTDRQRRALREWVAQGGRLVVTGERLLRAGYPWLDDLLPADVLPVPAVTPADTLPGLGPQPIAVLRPRSGALSRPSAGTPLIVSRPFGRGLVTAWAFDAFAPSARAWPGRTALWRQVIPAMRVQPVARPGLTDVMPTTRALSGLAQLQIIALSFAYVLMVRAVLRRFASRSGGWLALAAVVAAFTVALYATAAHSRRAASAVVQVSVLEVTGAAHLARVTSYVAVLQPYGGSYELTAPEDTLLRPLTPMPVTSTAAGSLRGDAPAGVAFFEAVGMVTLPLGGTAVSSNAGIELTVDNQTQLTLSNPTAYLNGQTSSLPEIIAPGVGGLPRATRASVTLAPGGWMPADRNAATGDFTRDARAWIVARLDGYTAPAIIGYKTLWLIGDVRDPRVAVDLEGSGDARRVGLVLRSISLTGGR